MGTRLKYLSSVCVCVHMCVRVLCFYNRVTLYPTQCVHTWYIVQVSVVVQSRYNTENGQRDYTESHKTETNDLHFDIPLLTPQSIYSVDVTAYTSEGSGPPAMLNVTLDDGREGMYVVIQYDNGVYSID